MPRFVDRDLLDCLERANPYTEYRIEIAEPDVGQVLRRQDQFLSAPSLVSETPASSLSASARGGLILTPTPAALAAFAGTAGNYDLNSADATSTSRYKGLSWTIDPAFSRAGLKSILAKVQATAFAGFFFDQTFECQVFQITRTPGVKVKNVGTAQYSEVAFVDYAFSQLLTPAPTVEVTAAQWNANSTQSLNFDFSNFGLILENAPSRAVSPDQTGVLPEYLVVVRLVGKSAIPNGTYKWRTDTVASHVVAGVGTFDRVFWARNDETSQWAKQIFTDVPNIAINIDSYPVSGQGVFLVDLGAAPRIDSTGRIEFQRALPPGTAATVELSTAGTGGPWTPVKHGDDLTARINLAIRANELDNAAWTKTFAAVTADAVIAPDGTLTGDKLTENDGGVLQAHTAMQLFAGLPDNTIYTWSRWFKAAERGWALLSYQDKAGVFHPTWFDLTNGAVGVTSAGNNATIVADPRQPGWWRASINVNTGAGATTPRVLTYIALANNVAGYIGTVGSGIYTWGAQFEIGSVATDFIPTAATAVTFGGAQQQYWLRTTLTPDAALHATPEVVAQGVEFRVPHDVSVEGVVDLPMREIELPWSKASIPEGKLRVVRTGSRDYADVASVIASTSATSRLEADIFLASRHPSITRDKWFRLERTMVSNRLPTSTSEEFTLLSYATRLKRKIPQKTETLNSVHVVVSSTTAQVVLGSVLPGTTVGGNEYDGKNYYMRVRSTSAPNTAPGYVQGVQGSTDTTKLDFTPSLPEALVAGDVIEVHSGIFQTQAVSWQDYDPADAWWEVLTNLLSIPPERIGIGSLPRGGLPPKVTDIAPGDAATQAKLKVTGRIPDETEGDKILDILSAIMGGVTLEMQGGQICFVQIFPLVDITGKVTVPLPAVAAVFDARDFASPPQTPPGIEQRATVVTVKYGVPATAASPDSFPSKATTAVDNDALLWLAQQDLDQYGTTDAPDEISEWLYNTADEGLYLASVIGARLVRACSTGMRVFPLSMTERHPRLAQGDVIVINIDSYTDYDPSTQTEIKGPMSIRGVLTRVGAEGRQLSMFVPGLRDNMQLLAGGAAGALTGLGSIPAPPILSASFDSTGQLIINSSGDFSTASQKIAFATGAAPSEATVRAAAAINQRNVSGLATGAFFAPGTTVFIAAFAYSGTAVESNPLAVVSVSNATGNPVAPRPIINPLNTEGDSTVWDFEFDAVAGTGGGGTNLTYVILAKWGTANEITESSGNAVAFPLALPIARDPQYQKFCRFILTDTATGITVTAPFVVAERRDEVTTVGGVVLHKRTVQYDDGGYSTKATSSDGLDVDLGVKAAGVTVHQQSRQVGRYFNETFEALPASWGGVNVNGVPSESLIPGVSSVGGNVLQSSAFEDWKIFPNFLPYNPTKLYRIRSRHRATVDPSSGGTTTLIGVQCFNASGTSLGNVYVGNFRSVVTGAGWFEETGWFKGAAGFTADYSSDPTTPVSLFVGTAQIKPLFIFRDGAGVGGTNQLDYIQIDELDEDASNRTYQTIAATGNVKRGHPWDDGVYALGATEPNGTTRSSSAHSPQGSILPASTDVTPFSYNAGGPSNGNMWVAWTWPAITLYLPDGTTIAVPASSSLATPPSPTLSQVAGGALAGRTRFVRIAYVKNTLMYHIGAEASIVLSANNLLRVASPPAVAGYDGWIPLVGTASNAEFFQPIAAVAFGTSWTEPTTGADFTNTPYDNTKMPNAVTATARNSSLTYFFYPFWDIVAGLVAFVDNGTSAKSGAIAIKQNMDGRIGLTAFTGMNAVTPAATGSGSGVGVNGGGKFL